MISTRLAAFFDIVAQDPVVSRVKLIGEPWDIGQRDSYSAGRFHRCGAVPRRNRYLADPGYTVWYTPSGRPMTLRDWQSSSRKSIAIYIDGTVAPDLGAHGQPMLDDDVLILVNGSPRPVNFTFPQAGKNAPGTPKRTASICPQKQHHASPLAPSTPPGQPAGAQADAADPARLVGAGDQLTVGQRSFVLLLAPQPST